MPPTLEIVVEGGDPTLAVAATDAPYGRRRREANVLRELASAAAQWISTL